MDSIEPDDSIPERSPDDGEVRPPEEGSAERKAEDSWLDDAYPLCDADFVGSTLDRVLHDRSEIESEAACVEQIRFEEGFLALYAEPTPAEGFVDDTLARVLADRAAGLSLRTDEEYEFHVLIEQAQMPEPGPDFVDRTLDLVLRDRAGRVPAPSSVLGRHRFSFVASIAAIMFCAFVLFWNDDTPPEAPPLEAPLAWASLLTGSDEPDGQFMVPIGVGSQLAAFTADIREGK